MSDNRDLMEFTPWDLFIRGLSLCGDFNGRAARREFWGFFLFYGLFFAVLVLLETLMLEGDDSDKAMGISLIAGYVLVLLMPGVSLMLRRLHDIGKSAWHLLPLLLMFALAMTIESGMFTPFDTLIPAIYTLLALAVMGSGAILGFMFCAPSHLGYNAYGANPYRIIADDAENRITIVEI